MTFNVYLVRFLKCFLFQRHVFHVLTPERLNIFSVTCFNTVVLNFLICCTFTTYFSQSHLTLNLRVCAQVPHQFMTDTSIICTHTLRMVAQRLLNAQTHEAMEHFEASFARIQTLDAELPNRLPAAEVQQMVL